MKAIPLSTESLRYDNMTKIGKVEIDTDGHGDILIVVSGFKFSDSPTCRVSSVRAMSWLRDLLEAQIRVEGLINGRVRSAVD